MSNAEANGGSNYRGNECAVCGEKGYFTINRRLKGKNYYFCNGSCEWMFIKDPGSFVK